MHDFLLLKIYCRNYSALLYVHTYIHISRRCLLGFACDFFERNSGSQCKALPFMPIKSAGIHDILEGPVSGFESFLLHCSGSQENMVVNSDMSTYSSFRKI